MEHVVNHLRKKNRNFRRNVSDVHIIKGREAVDGRYGKDANRVLRAIDSAEKDCGIRLLEAETV